MTIISKLVPVLRTSNIGRAVIIQTSKFSIPCSYYSTEKQGGLTKSKERADVSTDVRPLGEKIKETTKTVSYTGVILLGVGVTGIIFFYVFRELFSSNSPNSIYSEALEKCKNGTEYFCAKVTKIPSENFLTIKFFWPLTAIAFYYTLLQHEFLPDYERKRDPRVEDALGAPIKGYGEETTRRRRTHVSHAIYLRDGVQHMRMRFYIKGIRNKGVVEADMKQNEYGNYVCRYLLVQLDDYTGKTFIIEDNRAELDAKSSTDFGGQLPTLQLTQ